MTIEFTTPVGRIVQGQLWEGREVTDNKGVVKIGNDGQPMRSWFFALAIAKQPGHTHWGQTEWGAQIWQEGNRAHPSFAPHAAFAWKIEDGDSTAPNKKGKKNCEREGHPGHWILKFSSYMPINRTVNANGTQPVPPEAFKTGHYAQVFASVRGNTGDTPGIYLNPVIVALSGFGTEIFSGPDVAAAGFGAAPLPAGASATPLASMGVPPSPLPVHGGSAPPAVPSLPVMPPAAPALPVGYSAPVAPVMPPPYPGVLAGAPPVAPAPVMAPPPPPVAAAYQMTEKAGGLTRDQYIASGWNDDMLRQQGMML